MNRPSGLPTACCVLFSLTFAPVGLAVPRPPQAPPAAASTAAARPDGFTFTPAPAYRSGVPTLEELLGAPGGAAPSLREEGSFAPGDGNVGWVLPWGDAGAPAALLDLLAAKAGARLVPRAFATEARAFGPGAILVPRLRDEDGERRLEALLAEVADERSVEFTPIASFKSAAGIDLGSEQVVALQPPRIVVVASGGAGFGVLRWLLERELEVPFSCVPPDRLGQLKARDRNVVVIPGDARGLEPAKGALEQFLRTGGTVIAFGSSALFFAKERSGLTDVTAKLDDDATREQEKKAAEKRKVWRRAAQNEREATLEQMPGALFEVELDPDHPLAFGLPTRIPLLATGNDGFKVHGGGTKVGRYVQGGRGCSARARRSGSASAGRCGCS